MYLEINNCPGGSKLKDGKCEDFVCSVNSSCNNHGHCNPEKTACICDVGFSGSNCSFDLEGDCMFR